MNEIACPPLPLRAYRGPCIAMLRRYFCMSHELGRLPSVLGRELFRAQITTIHEAWFEDSVIFVCDVERCLELLEPKYREIIKRLVFQEYTQEELGEMLHVTERHVRRLFFGALDALSQLFIDRDLMVLPQRRRHMIAYDVLLEDPEEAPAAPESMADALDSSDPHGFTSISACAGREERSVSVVCDRNLPAWREFTVEIPCQPPSMSQIAVSL